MKIAVDCRYIGHSGIGRVCEGILDNLDYSEHEYYLIGQKKYLEKYNGANIVENDTEPYSFKGLRTFDKKLNKICDAIIIPNFLIPFGIKIPVYSIMHDLIFLDVKETTRGFKDRLIKKILLKRGMKKSKSIACVSDFTLSRCEFHFKKYSKKCYVNYQGLSKDIKEYCEIHAERVNKENKIVYVGNVKKHKGIKTLLSAFSGVEGFTLKIIGEKDNFLTGLKLDENAYENVEFTGRISDERLFDEIKTAKFLVQPSKYEGFGIPPLEALYLGTQPIISDIDVFREIYKELPVVYFNGENDLTEKLKRNPETVDCRELINNRYNYKNFVRNILIRIGNKSGKQQPHKT